MHKAEPYATQLADDPAFLTYLSSHVIFSHRTCSMVSFPRYPWASKGRKTRRATPPLPRMAWYMRSLCMGKVPSLSSASPCISSIGVLILSAYMKGDIDRKRVG